MSKNELQRSGEHRRCGFVNGASELYIYITKDVCTESFLSPYRRSYKCKQIAAFL